MNKLFKVIWSKSKQCYIVVSEVAKNRSGKKKIVVASVLAALTVGVQVATVEAAIPEGNTSNGAVVAIGGGAKASNRFASAMGQDVEVSGRFSVGIGVQVRAPGENVVAIGSGAFSGKKVEANENDAIAIGTAAQAKKSAGIAIGRLSTVETGERGIAIGNESKAGATEAIALGNKATATGATSVTIGSESKATGATAAAYGYKSEATGASAVAVGNTSKATAANAVAVGNTSQATAANTVAVGNTSQATEDSALAVGNGASASAVGTVALGKSATANATQAIAIGSAGTDLTEAPTATGTQSIAIGTKTVANSGNAIAMGSTASATGVATTAIGTDVLAKQHGSTAIGSTVKVEGSKAVGLGFQVSSKQDGSTAIGYITNVLGNQAVGIGSNMTVGENAGGAVAIGYMSSVTGQSGIGIGSNGTLASGHSAIALGNSTQATGAASIAIGKSANAALAHSVALGEGSTTATTDAKNAAAYLSGDAVNDTGNGIVSLGNKRNESDTGTITRRIVSVAGGSDDYDAVNVKQLKALEAASLKTLKVVNGATTTEMVPKERKLTLTAGNNVTLTSDVNTGAITIASTSEVNKITSGNTNALTVTNVNGNVTVTPVVAADVTSAAEGNKLVTAGAVKTALDTKVSNDTFTREMNKKANVTDVDTLRTTKVDKTDELHVKEGEYDIDGTGNVTLKQANGNGAVATGKDVVIKGVASKAALDTLTTTVAGKVDTNTFTTKLAEKSDKSYVDTQLGTKASTDYVNTKLAEANTKLEDALANTVVKKADLANLTSGKLDATAELHVVKNTYTVDTNGNVVLKQANGNNVVQDNQDVIISGVASKTDITTLTTEVGKKVSTADFTTEKNRVNAALANKLETADFNAAKANFANRDDIAALRDVLNNKLDKDTAEKFVQGMQNKVSTEELNNRLTAAKAASDTALANAKTELTNSITAATENKVDKADELHVKAKSYAVNADTGEVTLEQENGNQQTVADKAFKITDVASKAKLEALTTTVAGKADITYVNTELGKKADTSYVNTELGKKADTTYVDTKIADNAAKLETALRDTVVKKDELANLTVDKVDKTAELHVKKGEYTFDTNGNIVLDKVDGTGTVKNDEKVTITGVATKASVDAVTTRVTTAETNITNLTTDLGDTKTKLTNLTTKVGTVEATANAANTAVANLSTKVDGIDERVTDQGNRLSNAETSINTITTKLNDKVDSKDFNEKLTALKTEITDSTKLSFAGDETKDGNDTATNAVELNLKTDTLNVKGVTDEIHTVAKGNTITVGLSDKVKDQLKEIAKIGDTSADGRDGVNGTAKNTGLTAEDGLNGKTLTDKVNALRNGEAGSVVYTDADGNRLTKANNGKYYKANEVGSDGNPIGAAQPVGADKFQATLVNPNGTTTPTKLSNVADGTISSTSKDAATGKQLFDAKTELATALGGGATVGANGTLMNPTYHLTDKDGNAKSVNTVGDALTTINDRFNSVATATNADVEKLKNMDGLTETGTNVIKDLAKEVIDVAGDGKAINVSNKTEGDKKIFTVTLSSHLELAKPTTDAQGNVIETPNSTDATGNPIFDREKANMGLDINGHDGSITAGYGDSVVNIDGRHGAITAGAGANEVKLNGADGSVTANTGVFGDHSGPNGAPDKGKSKVTINDQGLSIVSMDSTGKSSSTITFKDGTITGLKAGTGDNDVATVGQMKEALANTSGQLGEAVKETAKRVNEVGAHAAALSAMNPLGYDPLRKSQIMAGIGTYEGNQALALGVAHYVNENFMFNAGVTMGAGKSMANLGATYRFGSGDDDIPERYKGGPISSIYVMQDEIAALKAENARKDAENAEMKAQIKMLMERMGMA